MQENGPSYVLSEGIQLLELLIICGSLCKKCLNKRFGESKLEEWSKYVGNEKKRIFVYDQYAIDKKGTYIAKQLSGYH